MPCRYDGKPWRNEILRSVHSTARADLSKMPLPESAGIQVLRPMHRRAWTRDRQTGAVGSIFQVTGI